MQFYHIVLGDWSFHDNSSLYEESEESKSQSVVDDDRDEDESLDNGYQEIVQQVR